jgi:hypothetical protein
VGLVKIDDFFEAVISDDDPIVGQTLLLVLNPNNRFPLSGFLDFEYFSVSRLWKEPSHAFCHSIVPSLQ